MTAISSSAKPAQAEATLSHFRAVVASSGDAIIGEGLDGLITSWNAGAEKIYGYAAGEVLGKSISLLVPSDKEDDLARLVARVRRGESVDTYETVRQRKDGSCVEVALTVSPILARDGRVVGASTIGRDITSRKQVESDLAHATKHALEASRQKSQFVANMSHEIRTPLNGVIGMTELLRGTPLNPVQREYVDALATSAEALLAVIDDILDFSKIEAGRLELDPVDFDLGGTVEEACLLLAEQARAKGLKLTYRVGANVPISVHGDRARLRQILLNLISNAVKFTPFGEVSVRVGRDRGSQLRFAVLDTGVGIDAKQATRLFEAFTQADQSTTRHYGGTGLGLAISRELVHRMGGQIGAEPREGGGSVFWFTAELPAAAAAEEPARARSEARDPKATMIDENAPTPEPSGPVVLVVEDNEVNRAVATALLAKRGLKAAIACDGLEAVRMAGEGEYAAILMDCQMPELDGYEATRRIRAVESGRRVPIIAMTACSMRGDRELCLAAGMDDYVSKPVRGEQLDAVIRRWLPDYELDTRAQGAGQRIMLRYRA